METARWEGSLPQAARRLQANGGLAEKCAASLEPRMMLGCLSPGLWLD